MAPCRKRNSNALSPCDLAQLRAVQEFVQNVTTPILSKLVRPESLGFDIRGALAIALEPKRQKRRRAR